MMANGAEVGGADPRACPGRTHGSAPTTYGKFGTAIERDDV